MHCIGCGARLSDTSPAQCDMCGLVHWDDAKPCAGAAVVSGGRILLVRRRHDPWAGHWDVPGGFCESTEHPIRTAMRELAEETGLDIAIVGFLGIWVDRYEDSAGRGKTTLNIYYHAVPRAGAGVPDSFQSDEVSEIGWFAPDELPARDALAFPDHLEPMLMAWRQALLADATHTPLWDLGSQPITAT